MPIYMYECHTTIMDRVDRKRGDHAGVCLGEKLSPFWDISQNSTWQMNFQKKRGFRGSTFKCNEEEQINIMLIYMYECHTTIMDRVDRKRGDHAGVRLGGKLSPFLNISQNSTLEKRTLHKI